MVTCDVCARLLKQRRVVSKTAPLTEINHGLKYSVRACEMRIFIQLIDSPQHWELAKTNLRHMVLPDKQLSGFLSTQIPQGTLAYICIRVCFETVHVLNQMQGRVSDVQFIRSK